MSRNTGGTLDPVTGVHDTAWIAEPMGDAKRLPEQRVPMCRTADTVVHDIVSETLTRRTGCVSRARPGLWGARGQPPRLPGKKSWIVAVNTPLSDKISRYTLKPGDGRELLDLCERIRTRVARETNKRVEIVCCYEAGYDGFWLHRLLEAHGIRNPAERRQTTSMSNECSGH